jgi:hypothetical protein
MNKGKSIHAGVFVQNMARGEIVHTVDNNAGIPYQVSNVLFCYLFGKGLNGYVRIYVSECFASGEGLVFPHVFAAVHYLTIQIRKFGFPPVTNPKRSHSGSCEVDSNWTSQASREHNLPLETFTIVISKRDVIVATHEQ